MATNNEVLNDIWIRLKEQELANNSSLSSNKTLWNKLFYYTVGAITDYLCQDDALADANLRWRLEFSGKFFEILPRIDLSNNRLFGDEELALFSAVAYDFAGYPGASTVALEGLKGNRLSLVEKVLADVLEHGSSNFPWERSRIGLTMALVFSGNEDITLLYEQADSLIENAYKHDNYMDIIAAECVRRVISNYWSNSTIRLMPDFSNTKPDQWTPAIVAGKLHPVLWRAQRELGKHNVFRGRSAVVQLPTGTGKTASFSLILRSGLYRNSYHVAIVVAPFKSIRDEIFRNLEEQFQNEQIDINSISTELKIDFSDFTFTERRAVLIVTPEKLLFMVQHSPNFLVEVGLFIFDEAHQLDNSGRGVTFELLLSTIDLLVSKEVQKVFVSAVIGNPDDVSRWFNSGENVVVSELLPRKFSRILGYSKWQDKTMHGELHTWNKLQKTNSWVEFPNFYRPVQIKKNKFQPNFNVKNHTEGTRWATALTTRQFVKGGMVAVYAPRKDSINGLSKVFIKLKNKLSEHNEMKQSISALCNLFALNFGKNSVLVNSYLSGIFVHDGDVPDGIRTSLEYEAHRGNIQLLLCTNTLAQGVNLPIKTLIITSVGNGMLELNDRDTINLVGRAGRTGVINESNVIFMQNGNSSADKRSRRALTNLMWDRPANALGSSLASLFMPTAINAYNRSLGDLQVTDWCFEDFLDDPLAWITLRVEKTSPKQSRSYRNVLLEKANGIWKIENYLMSVWDIIQEGNQEENIESIARRTFAATRIGADELELMIWTFKYLGRKIAQLASQHNVTIMGKMMVGVNEALKIEDFVESYAELILTDDALDQIIMDIWPILRDTIPVKDQSNEELYQLLLFEWVRGKTFFEILESWESTYPEKRFGKRKPNVEKVYQICSQTFQFDMQLKVNSLMELVSDHDKHQRLERLQIAMKTGLTERTANSFYEAGINDRVLASQFSAKMGVVGAGKDEVVTWMHKNHEKILAKFEDVLPTYFREKIKKA